jgi:hypothetical protein
MQELPGVHEHLARALSGARSAPGGGGQEACAPTQEQDSHSRQGKTAVTFKQAPWCGGGVDAIVRGSRKGCGKKSINFFVIW